MEQDMNSTSLQYYLSVLKSLAKAIRQKKEIKFTKKKKKNKIYKH